MMRAQNPDVVYNQNNGTLAVWPTHTGRLAQFEKRTKGDEERSWVFADAHPFIDDDGYERIDHITRGVVCGTLAEGYAFLDQCRELGFTVQSGGGFVPFSNSQRRHATDATGKPMSDYPETELRLMRWDLPTQADLEMARMA
ncbi:hypothetical protein HY478_00105 [Candidatus Uhrbacteria bacterium]|nr:hypothetical protein [Candidatus Uhrbacteria bacterium]